MEKDLPASRVQYQQDSFRGHQLLLCHRHPYLDTFVQGAAGQRVPSTPQTRAREEPQSRLKGKAPRFWDSELFPLLKSSFSKQEVCAPVCQARQARHQSVRWGGEYSVTAIAQMEKLRHRKNRFEFGPRSFGGNFKSRSA